MKRSKKIKGGSNITNRTNRTRTASLNRSNFPMSISQNKILSLEKQIKQIEDNFLF